jgi:hypothetical protein
MPRLWSPGLLNAYVVDKYLTLNPLTWKIWLAPNNASKWKMEFNSAFKGLTVILSMKLDLCQPSATCNFDVALRILANLCNPVREE